MQTKITTLLGAGLLGLLCAPTALPRTNAQGAADELTAAHSERVRTMYRAAAWTRGVPRDGLPIALQLEGWSAGQLRRADDVLMRSFTRAGAAEPSFVLESVVADSVDGAHGTLLTWLAGLQSPNRMPSARELGFELGDAAFVGQSGAGPGAVSWIAFARGNVAVRLLAVDPRREPALELPQIAGLVDAAIVARPVLSARATPTRPQVDSLVADRPSVAAGERVRLRLAVTDSAGGTPVTEWIVGGAGQGYVERADDGFEYLHATGPGAITLTAAVTSSTGTFAERSIDIDVTEER